MYNLTNRICFLILQPNIYASKSGSEVYRGLAISGWLIVSRADQTDASKKEDRSEETVHYYFFHIFATTAIHEIYSGQD